MNLNPDVHHRYALDRQQRLLGDAAALRLVAPTPDRTRIARMLRRTVEPLDAPFPCGRADRALAERA